MPDGNANFSDLREDNPSRPDRRALVCFAADAETEAALRQGLADSAPQDAEYRRADGQAAIAALRGMPTPWTLVVDVAGHPQPLALLEDLSSVVEPDVRVLVVGDRADVGFYRHLTRGLGAVDYLYKPLTPAMVAEHFAPIVGRRPFAGRAVHGGRMVTVTGARGGAGASTIAANLGWYLANVSQRHTLVLDADLHRGTVPLLLSTQTGDGLRSALERPERVDELFVERSAVALSERLHVLAAEEELRTPLAYAAGAAEKLIATLRRRYNLIIADVPFQAEAMGRDMLDQAQLRVVVMEPTLAGIRDALRLLQLPPAPGQSFRPLLVLNRVGRKGTLSAKRVAETMKMEPDVVLPDLPAKLEEAATMGQPAAATRGAFRAGIERLAAISCGVGDAKPARRGLFGMFRR
jgi:pilus assembly protein CpaE